MKTTNFIYEELKSIYKYIRCFLFQPYFYFKRNRISLTSRIEPSVIVNQSRIGKYCYIGPYCIMNNVHMGNYCSIAPSVQIGGTEHAWWWGSTSLRLSDRHINPMKTTIEDDVWIGANAVIRQGVRICRGSVIGACAVVTDDVPSYTIVAGIPAKPIKRRFPATIAAKITETNFWLYPPRIAKKLLEEIDYPAPDQSRTFHLKRIT